eukprot:311236_1
MAFVSFFAIIMQLIATLAIQLENNRYPVFWNVDETHEPKINISQFNILTKNYTQCGDVCSNQQDNCISWTQGYWSIINSSGGIINGGVPQNGNLTLHLETINKTLPQWIPNIYWSGNAVLDFEDWTTVWEYNNGKSWYHSQIYQNYSIQLVMEQHPNWTNQTQIVNEAKSQFETAATKWFVETLKLCKTIRSHAKWGFYGLPEKLSTPCHVDSNGKYFCGYNDPKDGIIFKGYSDKQIPIWQYSDIIYPSIYIPGQTNEQHIIEYINNTLIETLRCAQNGNRTVGNGIYVPLVYPYMMQDYQNGTRQNLLSLYDLNISVTLPYNIGVDGLVIWGSSSENNNLYWNYTSTTSGPLIKEIVNDVNYCSVKYCNQHGRCKSLTDYTCVCDSGYYGLNCSDA